MEDQGTNRTSWGRLVLLTLVTAIPASFLGFMLLMAWGSGPPGHSHSISQTLAGVIGFILLLPTMLLGYLVQPFGGLGMDIENMLMFIVQFLGYFGLVSGIQKIRDRQYRFGLKALLVTITTAGIILGIIAWRANL